MIIPALTASFLLVTVCLGVRSKRQLDEYLAGNRSAEELSRPTFPALIRWHIFASAPLSFVILKRLAADEHGIAALAWMPTDAECGGLCIGELPLLASLALSVIIVDAVVQRLPGLRTYYDIEARLRYPGLRR